MLCFLLTRLPLLLQGLVFCRAGGVWGVVGGVVVGGWRKFLFILTPKDGTVEDFTAASLLTPMSLAWFSKGKGKEKERQANGHRFSAGACLGSVVCMVCDKQASGKELLHCGGERGRQSSRAMQLSGFFLKFFLLKGDAAQTLQELLSCLWWLQEQTWS